MTTQLIAILASAGLLSAGVAATAETRSSSAIPAVAMAGAANVGKVSRLGKVSRIGAPTARQAGRPDCNLAENERLPACAAPGRTGAVGGGGGGVSGGALAAIAAGLGVGAIVIAAKNDSNG